MDLVSVCPLRIAGTLVAADDEVEFRVVVRATLEVRDGVLELAAKQLAPDADDCLYLVERAGVAPVPRRGVRLTAESLGKEKQIIFPDAAADQVPLRLPALTPVLFVDQGEGARAVALALGEVALDTAARAVGVVWRATVSIPTAEAEGRALLGMAKGDDPVDWKEIVGLAEAEDGVVHRVHLDVRQPSPRPEKIPEARESKSVIEDTQSLDTGELDEAVASTALPFGPTEGATMAMSSAPVNTALPFRASPPAAPTRKGELVPPASARPNPTANALLTRQPLSPPLSPSSSPPSAPPSAPPAPPSPRSAIPPATPSPRASAVPTAIPSAPGFGPPPPALRAPPAPPTRPDRMLFRSAQEETSRGDTAIEPLWVASDARARVRRHAELGLFLDATHPIEADRVAHELALAVRAAPSVPVAGLGVALGRAVGGGVLDPPALVVTGRFEMIFDPEDRLRALLSAARPIAASHERVAASLEAGAAALASDAAWLLAAPCTASLLDALASVLSQEAFRSVHDTVHRKLARDRKLARVDVAGASHVTLHVSADEATTSPRVALYLPSEAASRLPHAPRFPGRVIAIAHPPFDDREPGPVALVAVALFRTVDLPDSSA